MPEYLAPGVYVEEVSFRAKSIEGVSTTTTGFIGPARYGPTDMEPELLTSLNDFERTYGDGQPLVFEDAGGDEQQMENYLWHAVRAFFEEGGKRLYVVRAYRGVRAGDDPNTVRSERFDPLLPGFTDWGNWFQGEIAGEYFLANSNLHSHQIRAHVTPSDTLDGGLIFYRFSLDQLRSFIPIVTDKHLAVELDTYVEWKLNQAFTASFVLAFANPGAAVRQAFNRTKPFTYGMVMIAYSY